MWPWTLSPQDRLAVLASALVTAAAVAGAYSLWNAGSSRRAPNAAAREATGAPGAATPGSRGASASFASPEERLFRAAVAYAAIPEGSRAVNSSDLTTKLKLYGLYKRATVGQAPDVPPPRSDFAGRAKWDAWKAEGGLTPDEAQRQYVQVWDVLVPGWRTAPATVSFLEAAAPPTAPPRKDDAATDSDEDADTGGSGGGSGWNATSRPIGTLLGDSQPADGAAEPSELEAFGELCAGEDVDAVRKALAAHPSWAAARLASGELPLHVAADAGNADVLRTLLDAGADVNAVEAGRGQTALHYAVVVDSPEAVEFLLSRGAATTVQDADGACPSDLATSSAVAALLSAAT